MNSKLVVKITSVIIMSAASLSVLGAVQEPTRDDLIAAIKEEVADRLDNALMAEKIFPGSQNPNGQIFKRCILWKYIELVDFSVADKISGSEIAQYKLRPKFKWTASPAEIRIKDGCSSMENDPLGMPVKGGPAGDPLYANPTKYLMIKTDKGWRSIN
ncbi:MAG: hypothetical protein H7240_10810 [Glaciimonas sp.]|nr:hypothetical protein [Glaciimonas sp.]